MQGKEGDKTLGRRSKEVRASQIYTEEGTSPWVGGKLRRGGGGGTANTLEVKGEKISRENRPDGHCSGRDKQDGGTVLQWTEEKTNERKGGGEDIP